MREAVAVQEQEPSRPFASVFRERLCACGDPVHAPAQIAELFRCSFGASAEAAAVREALQSELLRWTLQKATAHTRFYDRDAYRDALATAPGAPIDLGCLPVLRRDDVAAHLFDMHADDVSFGSICHTSGCTGPALSIYRSLEEQSFLWDYHTQLLAPVRAKLPARPLVLSLPNLYHGTPVSVPSLGKVFVGGVTDDLLIGDLVKLLRQRFRIPGHEERLSIVTGLVHQMLFLTNYLFEQGIDPREFGIKSINVVGGYLTTRGRDYLRDCWGALVFDRFSLTESVGGATRCPACGHFHLDPHVIGEVLEVGTDTPTAHGVGRLVLTQLYPFVQMQPLIRYDTGDLVYRMDDDCAAGMTFEFAGKAGNCVGWRLSAKYEWLVLSVELHEILDGIPDFRRVDQFCGVRSAKDPSVGSLPVFALTATSSTPDNLVVALTLELRYAAHFYPQRVRELAGLITAGVMQRHPVLARRVAEGRVEFRVEFVDAGKLGDARILKI